MSKSWSAIKNVFASVPKENRRDRPKKRQKVSQKFSQLNADQNITIEDFDEDEKCSIVVGGRPSLSRPNYSQLNITTTKTSNPNLYKNYSREMIQKTNSVADKQQSILRSSSVSNLNKSIRNSHNDFNRFSNTFFFDHKNIEKKQLEETIVDADDVEPNSPSQQTNSIVDPKDAIQIDNKSESANEQYSQLSIHTSNTESIPFASQTVKLSSHQPQQHVPRKIRKQIPAKKGGLLEKFRKEKKRLKSNLSFWHHERHSDLIPIGEKLIIQNVSQSYGRFLIKCKSCDKENKMKTFCLDPSMKKLPQLIHGKVIEVQFDNNGYKISSNETFYPFVDKIYF